MKILINVPRGKHGGVANYYAGVKNKFEENVIYNYTGGRSNTKLFLLNILFDYVVFVFKLIRLNPDIVHVNPSLDKTSTIREGVFLVLAKILRKRVVVFWRGWEVDVEKQITEKYTSLFLGVYGKADAFIVLANDFAEVLRKWGIGQAIYAETTQIDDDLLDTFRIEEKKYESMSVLFMARIEKDKGIYETIDAVHAMDSGRIELVVAGSGPELEGAMQYVASNGISNVKFIGYAFGDDKVAALKAAAIYIFPTYYGEGMPNSVLEAMAFGLPVITRPAGGLKDFFENEKMGYITESKDYRVYAEMMTSLMNDREKMKEIGEYNYRYAQERFLASKVAGRLEEIYHNTLFSS